MPRIRVTTPQTADVNSFSIIQPDFGTSPTADSPNDTLNLTSTDNSITITGDSTTDTINFSTSATGGSMAINDAVYANQDPFDKTISIGGLYDETATIITAEDGISPFRITESLALHINIRDESGVELGSTLNPLYVQGNFGGSTVSIAGGSVNALIGGTASIAGGSLNITGDVTIGSTVFADIGSSINALVGGTVTIGQTLSSVIGGSVFVSGGSLNITGDVTVGSTIFADIGSSINALVGGTVTIGQTLNSQIGGSVFISGGSLNITGDVTVGSTIFADIGSSINALVGGTVSVSGGSLNITGSVDIGSTVFADIGSSINASVGGTVTLGSTVFSDIGSSINALVGGTVAIGDTIFADIGSSINALIGGTVSIGDTIFAEIGSSINALIGGTVSIGSSVQGRFTEYGTGGRPNLYNNVLNLFDIPTMALGDPALGALANVQAGSLNTRDITRTSGDISLGGLVTTFNNSTTTALVPFSVTGYRNGSFQTIMGSSGTPTDVQFFLLQRAGATYTQVTSGKWARLKMVDTNTNPPKSESLEFNCVGQTMAIRIDATGTDATNTFNSLLAQVHLRT